MLLELTISKDTAPDIYETPELTDDNSTVPVRTYSPFEVVLIYLLKTSLDNDWEVTIRR